VIDALYFQVGRGKRCLYGGGDCGLLSTVGSEEFLFRLKVRRSANFDAAGFGEITTHDGSWGVRVVSKSALTSCLLYFWIIFGYSSQKGIEGALKNVAWGRR